MNTVEETVLYCANHPNTETTLRCRQCEKLICPKCAVLTPTGYKCRECVSTHQRSFDTAVWSDYLLAIAIAGVLAFFGSLIARFMGFFVIFIAPVAGVVIAEAVRFAVRRRRSRRLFQIAALAAAIGSLPWIIILAAAMLGPLFTRGTPGFGALLGLVWQVVYASIVTSTVYYRLGGINIR